MKPASRQQRGFSLVEAVVAIVVMAIVSVGVVQFIGFAAEGYVDASNRNQLSASGRIAVDRMAMELRNALPYSVRISAPYGAADPLVVSGDAFEGDQCIEFIPVLSASTYIDPPFRPAVESSFTAVRFMPDQTAVTSAYAVIYPISTNELYTAPNPGPITAVSAVAHLDANRDELSTVSFTFLRRSPEDRVFLAGAPVSFCVNGERLYRYTGYSLNAAQLLPAAPDGTCPLAACLPAATPDRMLISTDLANAGYQAFDQLAATRRRNAIVQFELNFTRAGESVLLNHEVMLHNAP